MKNIILYFVILFTVFTQSCKKDNSDNLTEITDFIIIGKTDYINTHFDDYEPDLIYTAELNLNDTINDDIQSQSCHDHSVFGLCLFQSANLPMKNIFKHLYINSAVGNSGICATDTNTAYVNFFTLGDTIKRNGNILNESGYFEPAIMSFNYETNIVENERNANIENKYIGFKTNLHENSTQYYWIHFSLKNLDTLIVHSTFQTF